MALAPPAAAQAPRLAYDLGDLVFNRAPDHIALGYRLDGLIDYVPPYRDGRDVGPLRYDMRGLVAVMPTDDESAVLAAD